MPELNFRISGLTEEEFERSESLKKHSSIHPASFPLPAVSLPALGLIALSILAVYKLQERRRYISLDVIGHHAVAAPAGTNGSVFGSMKSIPHALKGNIYFLPQNTASLPDFSKLTPIATTYATDLNVTPRSFTEGFPGVSDRNVWFAIDYTGTFLIPEPGNYLFSLTSDDGSRLFIDGERIIDLDGQHPPQNQSGVRTLRAGPHDIRVQYFQGPPSGIALVLDITKQ